MLMEPLWTTDRYILRARSGQNQAASPCCSKSSIRVDFLPVVEDSLGSLILKQRIVKAFFQEFVPEDLCFRNTRGKWRLLLLFI